jgi:hypothetical protein
MTSVKKGSDGEPYPLDEQFPAELPADADLGTRSDAYVQQDDGSYRLTPKAAAYLAKCREEWRQANAAHNAAVLDIRTEALQQEEKLNEMIVDAQMRDVMIEAGVHTGRIRAATALLRKSWPVISEDGAPSVVVNGVSMSPAEATRAWLESPEGSPFIERPRAAQDAMGAFEQRIAGMRRTR